MEYLLRFDIWMMAAVYLWAFFGTLHLLCGEWSLEKIENKPFSQHLGEMAIGYKDVLLAFLMLCAAGWGVTFLFANYPFVLLALIAVPFLIVSKVAIQTIRLKEKKTNGA